MENRIRRKILALICTAAMLIGTFPIGIQAEGAGSGSSTIITIQPLGNNEFNRQDPVTISWSMNTTTDTGIKIDILQGDAIVMLITAQSGPGTFIWTVPGYFPYGENYKIRITSIEDSQVKADSQTFSITPGNWSKFASSSLTGSGTNAAPYEIKTAEELAYIGKQVNAGTSFSGVSFKLMNDIDLSAHYWTPIGVDFLHSFKGVFDGNGHNITKMTIGSAVQPATYTCAGLFGYLQSPGSVTNTKVIDAVVYEGDHSYVGALMGYNSGGDVSGCYTTGQVGVGAASGVGGIAGYNAANYASGVKAGNISNCGTECSVTGGRGALVGGFIGYSSTVTSIYNCYAAGDVEGEGASTNFFSDIGGFAGQVAGVILNCYAIGDVSGGDSAGKTQPCKVGGFAGEAYADILNGYAAGSVNGGKDAVVGGFAGSRYGAGKNINVYWNSSAEQKVNGQIRQNTELLGVGQLFNKTTDTSYRLSQEVMQGSALGSSITYTYNTTGDTAVTGDTAEAFVQALNRGIGALGTGNSYLTWAADTSHINNGYPIFTNSAASTLPAVYAVAVQNDGNGIGSASPSLSEVSETVKLSATANSNYFFKAWQVINPAGLVIANDEFVMPAEAVTVKAIFEEGMTVTFKNNGAGYSTQTVKKGTAIGSTNWPANPTQTGYIFEGWYTEPNGAGTLFTASTLVNNNTTVYAKFTYIGSGAGGSGSSGSSPAIEPVIPIIIHKELHKPIEAEVILKTLEEQNGCVAAIIPEIAIAEAISKAQAAQKEPNAANSFWVAVSLEVPSNAASLKVVLTQAVLKKLIEAQAEYLEINGIRISLKFSLEELKALQKQAEGDITITVTPAENLSEKARALVGKRPVYDFSITYIKAGQMQPITVMTQSPIFVSIPYTPATGEYTENLHAVYIDDQGKPSFIQDSYYDAVSKYIVWPARHFSVYGVAYQSPIAKFTDVSNHWAKESIDYVVSKGILPGTSENTFSPNEVVTRGTLVTALGRLQGIDVSGYITSSFKDIKAGSASLPYIEWAYKMGIVSGKGNKQFEPDKAVSREEIAAILTAYAKKTGSTLKASSIATTFADSNHISGWAKNSVETIQQSGLMGGDQYGKFNPEASTTRAEISSILYRYVNLTSALAITQK